MNSSTSSSEAAKPDPASDKRAAMGARLLLASMAGGLVLSAVVATVFPESWIHTGPEYGMAEGFEDHIERACSEKLAPELLIIGDSRAVAGVSVDAIRAAGIKAEKFALGGSGIFAGWATLDRLVDCGVRPQKVVMAYGTIHMVDGGSVMERTTNYDILRGSRAGHAYAMAAEWEDRTARKLTYKAVSLLGTGPTLVDLVLMRPALRNAMAAPTLAAWNHDVNEAEHKSFGAGNGDRFYGVQEKATELPDEARLERSGVMEMNYRATEAIAKLGRDNDFPVQFYILPVSELAKAKLPASVFTDAETFRSRLGDMGVRVLNDVWTLPDTDFGDPSHVNARGREKVTADFLERFAAGASLAGDFAGSRASQPDDAVSLATQKTDQVRQ